MLIEQLTVVLPMHNNEREIRAVVHNILDFSDQAKVKFDLVIVDDGSTDDTYETACELACRYPQVQVLRQPFRSGLAAVLDLVRNRLALDVVVLHDGASPVSTEQLRGLLLDEQGVPRKLKLEDAQPQTRLDSAGSRRFGSQRALQHNMERAHRQVTGFNWLYLEKPLIPRRRHQAPATVSGRLDPTAAPLPVASYLAPPPTGYHSVSIPPLS